MALNISRICDSQDRHQGRANKGTLNTESGISAAEILVSALPQGEEQPAGFLKNSGVCWFFFCFILLLLKKKKVFQTVVFLLLLRKWNILSLLAPRLSECCGGDGSERRSAVGYGLWDRVLGGAHGDSSSCTAPQCIGVWGSIL